MTLNAIVNRIKLFAQAHKQIKNFYFGNVVEFLNDKTTLYPSCFLQDVPGSFSGKERSLNFKMFLLDLVHVAEDAKDNELDVMSDMLSVGEDLISEMNQSIYTDWKLSDGVTINFVREELDDLVGGVVLDFAIVVPFIQDACSVPTNTVSV